MWFARPVVAMVSAVVLFVGLIVGAVSTGLFLGADLPAFADLTNDQKWRVVLLSHGAVAVGFIAFAVNRKLTIMSLRYQLDDKRDLQRHVDSLAGFRRTGITDIYASAPNAQTISAWIERHEAWERQVAQYLTDHFTFAIVEWFQDLGTIPNVAFTHLATDQSIRGQHQHHLQEIAKELSVLEQLIQQNTALMRPSRPSFSELITWARREHED
jgi:hypothetical protein